MDDGGSRSRFPVQPHHVEYWAAFQNDENVFWEKARQVGATWAIMIAFLWAIIFYEDRSFVAISEKELKVDSKDHNSMLGKVRVLLDGLRNYSPEWASLVSEIETPYLTIHNQATRSTIQGETARNNPDAGRGGSYSGSVMDEVAYIMLAEHIHKSLKRSSPRCRTYVSSPDGDSGLFARIRWDARALRGWHLITTRWDAMPGRDQAWFNRETEDMTAEQIASELLISYHGSMTGRIFYPFDRDIFANEPVQYVPREQVWRHWDMGVHGTAIIFGQTRTLHTIHGTAPKQLRIFDFYENDHVPADHYRDIMAEMSEGIMVNPHILDVGDPWMLDQKWGNLATWRTELSRPDAAHPYEVELQPCRCTNASVGNLIQNALRCMKTVTLKDGTQEPLLRIDNSQTDLIKHIESYKRPTNRAGKVTSEKPVKDEHSHSCDALQYFVWTINPPRHHTKLNGNRVKSGGESVSLRDFGLGGRDAVKVNSVAEEMERWT